MKKIIVTLFILFLTANVFANGEQEQSKVTVEVLHYRQESNKDFQAVADAYSEEHPNVEIIFNGLSANYSETMQGRIASGDMPTVFAVDGPTQISLFREYLDDLSDQSWVDLAFEGVLDGITFDQKVYGLPWQVSGYGLIYNKRILEEAGINIEEYRSNLTIDSLREIAVLLESKKEELGIEAVFALGPKDTWTIGNHMVNSALALEFGNVQNAFKASTVDFTYGNEFKEFLDLQLSYVSNRDTINNIGYSEQVERIFALEKAPLMHQGMWVYHSVKSINPELADNMGFLPIPMGAKTDSIAVGVPGYWVVNSEAELEGKEAAKDFLNYLYTSDLGKDAIATKINFVPPLKGYENFILPNPLARDIITFSNAGKTIPWTFQGTPSGWNQSAFGTEIQKYIHGMIGWDEVVSNSKREWEKARK